MKKFFLLLSAISLFCSGLLFFRLNYSFTVVLYHLLVMSFIIISLYLFNLALIAVIKKEGLRNGVLHAANALALFLFIQFYLLVVGSNFFWGKTITLSIMGNYAASANELLSILPLETWIFYLFLIADVAICLLFYIVFKPRFEQAHGHMKKFAGGRANLKWTAVTFVALMAGVALFHKPILAAKRTMHFAEEPLMEFTLGPMWGEKNEIAFDKNRYRNGLRDSACTNAVKRDTALQRPVILILVDALRANHLNMYGYGRNTAPFLDSLYKANKLVAVQHAYSTSTNTVGGIAGLFFSRDWNEFGFNGLSLMKYLKQSGYTTYAFLTGYHRDWYGLSALYRGNCDYYYESSVNPEIKSDDDLITLAEFQKAGLAPRSFVYIHLLSTHVIGKKGNLFKTFMPDKIGAGADRKTALVNNYDNGILQADYCIREVFKKLDGEGKLANATVMILADHGDLFGEGGAWGHGGNIHPQLLSVPLLIWDNDLSWYKNQEAATLKDVAPTVVERIGGTIPACWEGTSLHRPSHDFTVPLESVEACDRPYGVLKKLDNAIELTIMDKNKNIRETVVKKLAPANR